MVQPSAAAATISAHKRLEKSEKFGAPRPAFPRATPIEPVMQGPFADFIAGTWFRNGVIAVILASALLMGLQTSDWAEAGFGARLTGTLDVVITGIFVVELGLNLLVFRQRFFRDGWNIFDLIIVAISLVPATQGLKIIRTLRVLRILRLLSALAAMRVVITGLLRAIPGMASAIALLLIVIYVFAILAHQLFGAQCYGGYLDQDCTYFFGSLPDSLYTLFQIMTLESWSHGIVRPIADVFPWARWFFVFYVTLTAFAALNLFIGVVVNALDSAKVEDAPDQPSLADIKAELAEIKVLLAARGAS